MNEKLTNISVKIPTPNSSSRPQSREIPTPPTSSTPSRSVAYSPFAQHKLKLGTYMNSATSTPPAIPSSSDQNHYQTNSNNKTGAASTYLYTSHTEMHRSEGDVHNLLKKGQPTIPMHPGDMPPYSPPARSSFTPPQPPHPFADKPTLRGTNSDSGIINTNNFINRRPIPPPSLMPGQERIPYRPPDLVGAKPLAPLSPLGTGTAVQQQHDQTSHQQVTPTNSDSRKKALNTPADKNKHKLDGSSNDRSENGNGNSSDPLPSGGVFHFPSISRILSGSNGRKEVVHPHHYPLK